MKKNLFLLAFALIIAFPFGAMSQEKEKILTLAEEFPEFLGGFETMKKFLSDNIKYPAEALEKGISGRVYIGFVVEKDGRITDAEVKRGVEKTLDAEALRVVKIMPKWKPGKQKGEAVRVAFSVPIDYVLPPKDETSKSDTIKSEK